MTDIVFFLFNFRKSYIEMIGQHVCIPKYPVRASSPALDLSAAPDWGSGLHHNHLQQRIDSNMAQAIGSTPTGDRSIEKV